MYANERKILVTAVMLGFLLLVYSSPQNMQDMAAQNALNQVKGANNALQPTPFDIRGVAVALAVVVLVCLWYPTVSDYIRRK